MNLSAYAKLNLSLRVLGSEADGFHTITSLVQTIDLSDTITVREGRGALHVKNDAGIPSSEDLVTKAATLLLAEKGCKKGIHIQVEKRIPIGAGLGGGSSDAAATLWAIDQLTPPPLSQEHLVHLATYIGSDVPLFLTGGRMCVRGRGEQIRPLPARGEEYFLLVVPPIRCSTSTVYAHFDRMGDPHPTREPAPGENDLEAPALHLYPALTTYRHAVAALNAPYFGMSGSGSTFFAVFPTLQQARAAQGRLVHSIPKAQFYLCQGTSSGFRTKEGTDANRH
jgi:4-diphosphocytidyl-2-C-methyl-D-erythritol kinase